MGWFDGASDLGGGHHRSSSHHHGSSSGKHHSTGSIFGSGSPRHNSSRSSFFGLGNRSSSSSYYKRSPRTGYLKRIYAQLRRLLRNLMYYLKRHPLKVFMLVIMPLITGGALTGLLARFGIRLPGGLEKIFGGASGGSGGLGIGRGSGGGMQFERSKVEGPLAALGGLGNLAAGMGGVGGAMNLAKMFM